MSEMVPFARTALLNGTGIGGIRVGSEDDGATVKLASAALNNAALSGEKWIPIVSGIEMQDLTPGTVSKSEEYFLALQSLDNFRLSLYGLDNGGLFQKKSHMLEGEQEMNAGRSKAALIDGLQWRQRACDIATAL